MGAGIGNRNQGSQVYYDPATGQYYTANNSWFFTGGSPRNYIGQAPFAQSKQLSSNMQNLVNQAMSAQANPVSMAQLFPYMNYGTNTGGLGGLLGMTGQYGAGRFLGGNAMGNTSMTSNAMNTM